MLDPGPSDVDQGMTIPVMSRVATRTLPRPPYAPSAMAISGCGAAAVSALLGGAGATAWRVADGRTLGVVATHRGHIWGADVTIAPGTGLVLAATAGEDGLVRVWALGRDVFCHEAVPPAPQEVFRRLAGPRGGYANAVRLARAGAVFVVDFNAAREAVAGYKCLSGLQVAFWRRHAARTVET